MNPLVSVVMPAFNMGRTIESAIRSVLGQTYQNYEILIVDDGSTDDTLSVAEKFPDRVRCLQRPHGGAGAARNAGFRESRGDLIALIDADDLWEPDRLERGIHFLKGRPETGLVHAEVEAIDEKGRLLKKETQILHRFYQMERKKGSGYLRILDAVAMFSSSVLFRRECLKEVGFYNETLPTREDYDWYLRFALHYPIALMDGPPVCQYRFPRVPSDNTEKHRAMYRVYAAICEKQLRLVEELFRNHPQNSFYKELPGKILVQAAKFQAAAGEKKSARSYVVQALQKSPGLLMKDSKLWKSLWRSFAS